MRFSLIPREMRFFELFNDVARQVTAASGQLVEMLTVFDRLPERGAAMKADEERVDAVIGKIIKALDRSFITPFDREDIHALAGTLDDVMDDIEEAAHRFEVFRIDRPTEAAVQLAGIIQKSCSHLEAAIRLLDDLRKSEEIQSHIREISLLENEGDRVYREADAGLFAAADGDLLGLIKWRELYAWLEQTIDSVKKAAYVVAEIVIKGT
jgi:predicted phosphate transport protein (TIGR00153 family)